MNGFLIDAYRTDDRIVLWVKTADGLNRRLDFPYTAVIYADLEAIPDLRRERILFKIVQRKTYLQAKHVLELQVPSLSQFEYFIYRIERITRHKVTLYNADIKPEQMFLYEHDLYPFRRLRIEDGRIAPVEGEEKPALRTLEMDLLPSTDQGGGFQVPVRKIIFNDIELKGPEHYLLKTFAELFSSYDPDAVMIKRAYAMVPYLAGRLNAHGLTAPFHRWDALPLEYRGGRSYWSYSQVRYQDYSVRLRGRLLIDTSTFVGSECDLEGIIELVDLSGTLLQPTASRSFGAVFQTALVRLMAREGMIVAYKEKPIEPPLSMFTMLKADRGGLTIDPKVGFHQHVAELDFTSMFPWLIYNHNISAECMLTDEGPFEEIPHLPVKVSTREKGLIPRALKPFIDRRMHYKKHPSPINDRRAKGLKWVLVSCYGYLRFREFKLGIPTSHMAICAWARQVLLQCMHLAEARGFEVVHAIVDSFYITKPGMTEEEVRDFCKELEAVTQIPLSFEGIFKWIVFLPSRVDPDRALPATYFGVFDNGEVKVRGLELRQKGVPRIVKAVQEEALRLMKDCASVEEVRAQVPGVCVYVRSVLEELPKLKPSLLTTLVCIRKTDYRHNIPQKVIVEKLAKKGIQLNPGQFIEFLYSAEGPVLPEEYKNNPDKKTYRKLFVRALSVLFGCFGFGSREIAGYILKEQQKEFDFSSAARVTGQGSREIMTLAT